ncbi:hypothetical protein DOS62_06660 [Staphylococcus felis]|uniref:hypothetical protein n=1 Tax=Staphylococcus felis TaxID=46127 RepID=UPI000E2433F6|nr:hypothetical protein [Staphylococcus felis]REI04066.1 hypothetical protein DOS62_06660 [Staphylococcus felis]
MRYANRVTFISKGHSKYNPKTSRIEQERFVHDEIPCNINPLSRQRIQLEFGDYRRDISVVRVQGQLPYEPTNASIGNHKYIVVDIRKYTHDTSIFVEEILNES